MDRVAAAALVLLLSGCAKAPLPSTPDAHATQQLYELSTTVLESRGHGPMLCPGGVATSLPPQCGNVPITNWDWDAVQGEERMYGTIWGSFHVVGTYDGEAFTVTEVGPPVGKETSDDDPIEAGCPEPEGGWEFQDPSRASEGDLHAADRTARQEPDFSGFWIDHLETANVYETGDPYEVVATAAFTGDLDRHEAELRELWGGPLCLVRHERTYRELRTIQKELTANDGLGLDPLYSSVDVVDNVVEIHVVVLDDRARAALDERYGEGTVRATAALAPVG